MRGYNLLVVGDIYDNHIIRFVTNLKRENPDAKISLFATRNIGEIPESISSIVSNIFWQGRGHHRNRLIRRVQSIKGIIAPLKQISKSYHFEVVNIHFPLQDYFFAMPLFKKISNYIVLTPWGSDVYRSSKIGRLLLRRVFNKSDYICGTGNRFSQDVGRIFRVPKERFVNLDIGSETIDYITEYKDKIDKNKARELLGISCEYAITCGYNAHKAQNHLSIIDSIFKVKKQLPEKTTLLFPLTYPKDESYINAIKQRTWELGMDAVFFETYLTVEKLFLMRQATDMFIHVQNTDANAASVQEYLLLSKNVINGVWLRYGELETNTIPYHLVSSLDDLAKIIVDSYKEGPINLPSETIKYIESYGWKPWIKKWNDFFVYIAK